jgi:type IV pilus assembly protein PilX
LTTRHTGQTRPGQSGFALITGLLLLIVMSLIGISMMNVTRLETMMAGGARESHIAFHAAETGLRDAEDSLVPDRATASCALTIDPNTSASGHYGQLTPEPDYLGHDWTTTSSPDYTTYTPDDYPEMQADRQPRHIIKHLREQCIVAGITERLRCLDPTCPAPTCEWVSDFRVTAWGSSRDGTTTSLLQTHVACFP